MTGIIVIHDIGRDLLDLRLANWSGWFDNFEFVVPADSVPTNMPGTVYSLGASCRGGRPQLERMRMACKLAARHDQAVIVQFDTLLFGKPVIPVKGIIAAGFVLKKSDEVLPKGWLAGLGKDTSRRIPENWWTSHVSDWFSHSPWICAQEDYAALSRIDVDIEKDWIDRWLAAACDICGIVPLWIPKSFSRDEDWDHMPGNYSPPGGPLHNRPFIEQAMHAVLQGAQTVHGAKSVVHVQQLLEARRKFEAT